MAGNADYGPGVARAWDELSARPPEEICHRAHVRYDASEKTYTVPSLGTDLRLILAERKIAGEGDTSALLLGRLAYFTHHAVLWYLVNSGDFPETGRLVAPAGLKGGAAFFAGTHDLPLNAVATKYNSGPGLFLERGASLGGRPAAYGDVSVTIRPLPKVPATLLLWQGDDEFPPRADLLLDSSIEIFLPLDIIWSAAMMSVLSMM